MSARRGQSLYLARRSYRHRRVVDAARLLPLVGMFLVALPVLWAPEAEPASATARQGLYIFAVWLALIVAAWVLARQLPRAAEDEAGPGPG